MPNWPFDFDNANHQIWIKDVLWRVVEELAESYEAFLDKDIIHTLEELADALHFATELMILTNIEPFKWDIRDIIQLEGEEDAGALTVERVYFNACYYAGLVGNTLKNKKWKQSQMPTDKKKFIGLSNMMYRKVLCCFFVHKKWDRDIYEYYLKKIEVNKFRQRTNY